LHDKLQLEAQSLAPGLCLIFDMDGVIVDSNPMHRQAWEAYNRRFGLETTEEMQKRMYGRRNDQIVRDFFGDGLTPEEVERRGADKEELYREMVGDRIEEMLVPGVRQFLQSHREVPMAVASNGEPANVSFLLDRAGLRPYFRAVVDGQQVRLPKPHPEIYLRTAKLLGADPANCIVFEDSQSGVEAARAAGMRIVLLCTTHGNLPGASLSVDNFLSGELWRWLAVQARSV
jgi:beta-phosphoglucomutase family hydrolase